MIGLIVTSVSSMVLQNAVMNGLSKNKLRDSHTVYSFNLLMYAVCAVAFGILTLLGSVSLYTVALGAVFGILTGLSNTYKALALSVGPMHLTLLFTTSSMIIPTLSGIFFGEAFSLPKLLAVLLLIPFLYLSFDRRGGSSVSGKWFLFSILAFLFQGAIGVFQKIHQSSAHRAETGAFLFVAFLCAIVFALIRTHGRPCLPSFGRSVILLGLVCGACSFSMNYINLKLSGLLPSQLFFPVINGSSIILCSLLSVLLFKERLSRRQGVALVGGILSLVAICLVP